jgi:hypothetical protein
VPVGGTLIERKAVAEALSIKACDCYCGDGISIVAAPSWDRMMTSPVRRWRPIRAAIPAARICASPLVCARNAVWVLLRPLSGIQSEPVDAESGTVPAFHLEFASFLSRVEWRLDLHNGIDSGRDDPGPT